MFTEVTSAGVSGMSEFVYYQPTEKARQNGTFTRQPPSQPMYHNAMMLHSGMVPSDSNPIFAAPRPIWPQSAQPVFMSQQATAADQTQMTQCYEPSSVDSYPSMTLAMPPNPYDMCNPQVILTTTEAEGLRETIRTPLPLTPISPVPSLVQTPTPSLSDDGSFTPCPWEGGLEWPMIWDPSSRSVSPAFSSKEEGITGVKRGYEQYVRDEWLGGPESLKEQRANVEYMTRGSCQPQPEAAPEPELGPCTKRPRVDLTCTRPGSSSSSCALAIDQLHFSEARTVDPRQLSLEESPLDADFNFSFSSPTPLALPLRGAPEDAMTADIKPVETSNAAEWHMSGDVEMSGVRSSSVDSDSLVFGFDDVQFDAAMDASNESADADRDVQGAQTQESNQQADQEVVDDAARTDAAASRSNAPSTPATAPARRGRKQSLTEDPSKPFKCNLCNTAFRRMEHLKRHHRSIHTAEKPYTCNECNKSFSRSDNLAQHQRTHGQTPLTGGAPAGAMAQAYYDPQNLTQMGDMLYQASMEVSSSDTSSSDDSSDKRNKKKRGSSN